ncbi:heat shock factor protein 1-like isoform X2 [Lineus longissimus]|uniref:heat shock factor protein 1-like isoform X2 n=1 Tax=Lineus longissimus TaxID=88925 RepID=UPI002B4C8E7A
MHQQNDMGAGSVPAFLNKLWTLVEDPSTNNLIYWDPNGLSFHVVDQARFAKEVLPLFFKHSNIASFIRQLNMYGFRKIMTIDQGGLKTEKDSMQFQHPYFIRGKDHLLEMIKRKVSANPKQEDYKFRTEDVSKVLLDVNHMKGKQDHIDSRLETLKRENEALWSEISDLRQKHGKQQQIVNKLIQFLMTLVGSRGLGGMKRKMPLMINDSSHMSPPKAPKYSRQLSLSSGKSPPEFIDVMVPSSDSSEVDPSVCKIEDITKEDDFHDLKTTFALDEYDDSLLFPIDLTTTASSTIATTSLTSSSRSSSPSLSPTIKANSQMAEAKHMNTANKHRLDNSPFPQITSLPTPSSSGNNSQEKLIDKLYTRRDDFSEQVEFMQSDLETLRDMLSGSPYFDPNTMAGLFHDGQEGHQMGGKHNEPVGNEVVQYMPVDLPSLFELTSESDDPTLSTLNTIHSSKDNLETPVAEHHMIDPLSEYMIPNKGLSTVTPSDDLD